MFDVQSNKECSPLKNSPLEVFDAAGGIVDGKPLICGGYSMHKRQTGPGFIIKERSECYIHHKSSNSWRLHCKMQQKRSYHTSVPIKDGLWLTGGRYGNRKLKSSEFVFANGSVAPGPDLPNWFWHHCVVDLSGGKYMIIGMRDTSNRWEKNDVIIYDSNSGSFRDGPSLLVRRSFQACVVFNSPLHNDRPVVLVAGGDRDGKYTGKATMEVLDFTKDNAVWESCE